MKFDAVRRRPLGWLFSVSLLVACQQGPHLSLTKSAVAVPASEPKSSNAAALSDATPTIAILASDSASPTPVLRWTPLDAAAAYTVEVDDSDDCTSPLQTYTIAATGSQQVRPSQRASYLENGYYHVCVTALSTDDEPLSRATSSFWVFTQGAVDPAVQNGRGGSGGALHTPDLLPQALYQDDWTLALANRGRAASANTVDAPFGFFAFSDPDDDARLKFAVNDRGNHRVLIYSDVPADNSAAATIVVGQATFDATRLNASGGADTNRHGMSDNVHVSVCPSGQLLVTDRGANRVMVWTHVPKVSGAAADLVIGHTTFSDHTPGSGADHLDQPAAAYCLGGDLFIVDRGNHRVLGFRGVPTQSGAVADFVIGQPDFATHAAGCTASSLNSPSDLLVLGTALAITDTGNHRVTIYDQIPSTSGAKASFAVGQERLSTCQANRDGAAGADTLSSPTSLASRDQVLAIADSGNHRVLFVPLPLAQGAEASAVLGQPDMNATRNPDSPSFGSVTGPRGLLFDGTHIWVGDPENRRIAIVPLPF